MPMIDAGTTSFNAAKLYSFARNIHPPTVADLREPVTFYRSARIPMRDPATGLYTDDVENDVTPYHNAWAQVWQDQEAMLKGQNTQNQISHAFLVRNFEGFQPETRDAVLWKGVIHMIKGTRNLQRDSLRHWILILAEQEGAFADEPRTDTVDQGTTNDDPAAPLWR